MLFLLCLVGFINFQLTVSEGNTYKAGIVDPAFLNMLGTKYDLNENLQKHLEVIQDGSRQNIDMLVFPLASLNHRSGADEHQTLDTTFNMPSVDKAPCDCNMYPEAISYISCAAKDARMYVVVTVTERKVCWENIEIYLTNLVFDRNGNIAHRYSKTVTAKSNCSEIENNQIFETDFGVSFGVLTDIDILYKEKYEVLLKSKINNFILLTNPNTYAQIIPTNFPSSWAYVHRVNLLVPEVIKEAKKNSNSGINCNALETEHYICTKTIQKEARLGNQFFTVPPLSLQEKTVQFTEDLSSHRVEILQSTFTNEGQSKMLCHDGFCCDFFVKTSGQSSGYLALTVFNGIKMIGTNTIGVKICNVIVCGDVADNKCIVRSSMENNLLFEIINISGNFSKHASQQYPAVLTADTVSTKQFTFDSVILKNQTYTEIKLSEPINILSFGILSREYSRDGNEISKLSNEVSQEFYFDKSQIINFVSSLWITVRYPILFVSIYVLEQL